MSKSYSLKPAAMPLDENGQPLRVTKAHWDNYLSKAFDQLKGICHGILADGYVNDHEADYFRQWIAANARAGATWPFSELTRRVEAIFADGIVTDEERDDLAEIMKEITGGSFMPIVGTDDTSTDLPITKPIPDSIVFSGYEFCVTGRFAFGTRTKVTDAIRERGGLFNANPTRSTRYLVIGHFCSRDWKYTSYGNKIERAMELREKGSDIVIINEELWTTFCR